mmetsp:Transcript_23635/g.41890  ORF Transcript_23635/g.41890 Transcript_23635/m.41890 type:complete len:231 (+) Transcript_23635:27-719(+)
MVLFVQSRTALPLFYGENSHENDTLLAYAHPEDVWFHVESLSSAHVYVRMPILPIEERVAGVSVKHRELPTDVVIEACQLTKANSIEGCKKVSVMVIYTPASNLAKERNAKSGEVRIIDQSQVIRVEVHTDKKLVKQLLKTKEPRFIEFQADLSQRKAQEERDRLHFSRAEKIRLQQEAETKRQEEESKSYRWMQRKGNMQTNKDEVDDFENSQESELPPDKLDEFADFL